MQISISKAIDWVIGKQKHSCKITTRQVASDSLERLNSSLGQGKSGGLVHFSDVLLDLQGFHLYANLLNDHEKSGSQGTVHSLGRIWHFIQSVCHKQLGDDLK